MKPHSQKGHSCVWPLSNLPRLLRAFSAVLGCAQIIQGLNKWANATPKEIIQVSQCWKCSLPAAMAWNETGNPTGWNIPCGTETRSGLHPLVSPQKLLRWELRIDESQSMSKQSKPDFSFIWYMICTYQNLTRVSWGIIRHISSSRIVPRSVASWFKMEGCRDCSKSTLLVSCELFSSMQTILITFNYTKGKSLTRQTSTFRSGFAIWWSPLFENPCESTLTCFRCGDASETGPSLPGVLARDWVKRDDVTSIICGARAFGFRT